MLCNFVLCKSVLIVSVQSQVNGCFLVSFLLKRPDSHLSSFTDYWDLVRLLSSEVRDDAVQDTGDVRIVYKVGGGLDYNSREFAGSCTAQDLWKNESNVNEQCLLGIETEGTGELWIPSSE